MHSRAPRATASRLKANFGVLVIEPLMVVIPPQLEGPRRRHVLRGGLHRLAGAGLAARTGGRLAVELGTGTGFLSAALAPRYELVIATELLRSSASVAALTFRLNGTEPKTDEAGCRFAEPMWPEGSCPAARTS